MGGPDLGHPLCCPHVPDGLEVRGRHYWLPAPPWPLHLLQVCIRIPKTRIGIIVIYPWKPDANWGSSADALTFINAMKSTQELTDAPDHIKNYRPKVLVLTGGSGHTSCTFNDNCVRQSRSQTFSGRLCQHHHQEDVAAGVWARPD